MPNPSAHRGSDCLGWAPKTPSGRASPPRIRCASGLCVDRSTANRTPVSALPGPAVGCCRGALHRREFLKHLGSSPPLDSALLGAALFRNLTGIDMAPGCHWRAEPARAFQMSRAVRLHFARSRFRPIGPPVCGRMSPMAPARAQVERGSALAWKFPLDCGSRGPLRRSPITVRSQSVEQGRRSCVRFRAFSRVTETAGDADLIAARRAKASGMRVRVYRNQKACE